MVWKLYIFFLLILSVSVFLFPTLFIFSFPSCHYIRHTKKSYFCCFRVCLQFFLGSSLLLRMSFKNKCKYRKLHLDGWSVWSGWFRVCLVNSSVQHTGASLISELRQEGWWLWSSSLQDLPCFCLPFQSEERRDQHPGFLPLAVRAILQKWNLLFRGWNSCVSLRLLEAEVEHSCKTLPQSNAENNREVFTWAKWSM